MKYLIAAGLLVGGFTWCKSMNKTISDQGLALIKHHEGLRLNRYNDAVGYPTIGYGHLIKDGENLHQITEAEAEALLRDDVREAENAVNRLVKVPVTQEQFDALVSFTFNLGSGSLSESTLLRKLNAGDYAGAANEFPRWVYADGNKLTGLVNRRHDERGLFVGGIA